jgi:hypothetical protein
MAKVTITFENTEEKNGFSRTITLVKENVHDLYDLTTQYCDAARAEGYLVKAIAAEQENENIIWSDI